MKRYYAGFITHYPSPFPWCNRERGEKHVQWCEKVESTFKI